MEKEFVPYQESLELKELGFDEPCLTYYFSDGTFNDAAEEDNTLYPGDPRFYSDTNSSLAEYCENELQYKAISAPTFSQAFRWFREKNQIDSWIYPNLNGLYSHVRESYSFNNTLEFVSQINGSYVNHGIYDKPINRFETYEEAELECLKKLIQLVKNK